MNDIPKIFKECSSIIVGYDGETLSLPKRKTSNDTLIDDGENFIRASRAGNANGHPFLSVILEPEIPLAESTIIDILGDPTLSRFPDIIVAMLNRDGFPRGVPQNDTPLSKILDDIIGEACKNKNAYVLHAIIANENIPLKDIVADVITKEHASLGSGISSPNIICWIQQRHDYEITPGRLMRSISDAGDSIAFGLAAGFAARKFKHPYPDDIIAKALDEAHPHVITGLLNNIHNDVPAALRNRVLALAESQPANVISLFRTKGFSMTREEIETLRGKLATSSGGELFDEISAYLDLMDAEFLCGKIPTSKTRKTNPSA